MKITKYLYGVALGALSLSMASCYNADKEFPDYEGGTTAYFAYQDPVRTLILGNDIYDNTLDNNHKCQIWATMGGSYNGGSGIVEFVVDPSLCDNLFFVDGAGNPAGPVMPMPSNYYKLAASTIPYNGVRGYVEVDFADAFFNDPLSVENTYVIPLRMTNATGIDHILTGTPREGLTPSRTDADNWEVLPKDYVLYCVKYMNPWQARYIRRGVDKVTEAGQTQDIVRKDFSLFNSDPGRYTENYVNANDEVCSIMTKDMKTCIFPVTIDRITYTHTSATDSVKNEGIPCNLILTFDGNKCTITSNDADVEVSGTGEFITKGTEKSEYKEYQWGNMNGELVHRDILRLAYNITFKDGKYLYTKVDEKTKKEIDVYLEGDMDVITADTLVVQTRESNKKVFFSPTYVK